MPSVVAPSVVTPSIRRRLACVVYEALLLSAVLLALTFPFVAFTQHLPAPIARAGLQFYLLVIAGGYFVIFWHKGQTLAMKTWNLKIVEVSGHRAGWGQLLLRYGLACLNLVCLGLGWWTALFRKDRQFLQDHYAGTQLILVSPARSQPSADQATTLP